jgi:phosphatidylethanolamine-binding protein (PEBP) family uncharacterized protein
MKRLFLLCLALTGTSASYAQSRLDVAFTWNISHRCSPVSPEIRLKDIPAGTTRLVVKMTDLDQKDDDHGGGSITPSDAFGNTFTIESGALKAYKGPCPENFTTLGHEYQFSVSALGADDKVLAVGSAKAPFSAKFVILQGLIRSP